MAEMVVEKKKRLSQKPSLPECGPGVWTPPARTVGSRLAMERIMMDPRRTRPLGEITNNAQQQVLADSGQKP